MRTHPGARIIALASISLFLAAACAKREDASRVDTAAGTVANDVAVTDVDIGRHIGADKKVTDKTDDFARTDTVYAVVSTSGSSPSATLEAKWTFQDGQVVDQSTETIAPSGPAVTEFHISKPDGLPAGKYKVEVLLNGNAAGSKDFTVK
ncbi:MAG TPA: hypothetical protein VH762_04230 [Gemmatimonadaceae bacterium]|jgi:hypothetical protein